VRYALFLDGIGPGGFDDRWRRRGLNNTRSSHASPKHSTPSNRVRSNACWSKPDCIHAKTSQSTR